MFAMIVKTSHMQVLNAHFALLEMTYIRTGYFLDRAADVSGEVEVP